MGYKFEHAAGLGHNVRDPRWDLTRIRQRTRSPRPRRRGYDCAGSLWTHVPDGQPALASQPACELGITPLHVLFSAQWRYVEEARLLDTNTGNPALLEQLRTRCGPGVFDATFETSGCPASATWI